MDDVTMVTGAAGLVGSHMVDALRRAQKEFIATYFRPTIDMGDIADKTNWLQLDVCSFDDVHRAIAQHRPSVIVHLAAQSLPTVSWTDPWGTLDTNVQGTINVFEAVRKSGNQELMIPALWLPALRQNTALA
jgi:GDP-4-dehydro-6-deoxy-D-mannose reductase